MNESMRCINDVTYFDYINQYTSNYQQMLRTRAVSPKPLTTVNRKSSKPSLALSNVNRAKSMNSFQTGRDKIEVFKKNFEMKSHTRINSAVKMYRHRESEQIETQAFLPKFKTQNFQTSKGKLHLGKMIKPKMIMGNEHRNNPWGPPQQISENLISQKGLMEMVNMGMFPRTADLSDILNHAFQIPHSQIINIPNEQNEAGGFFRTNPNILEKDQPTQLMYLENREKTSPKIIQNNEEKVRKRTKKISTKKKQKKQEFWKDFFQQKIVLQLNNQEIQKNDKYRECLVTMRNEGNEIAFKNYIKSMENFAKKYKLKRFEFHLLIDQTKKMSDRILYQQILNTKVIGVYLAMKGNSNQRGNNVAQMVLARYKYKKSRKQLLKIQNIKRFFRIKKYYEEMARKRKDLIQFKLGSFAENQRRYVQQYAESKGDDFRAEFHIPLISDSSWEEEQTYYKLSCRNNIQLTRLFNSAPQFLIFLTNQPKFDIKPWTNIINKLSGHHPFIQFLHCDMQFGNTRAIDELYYGISKESINIVKRVCGKNQNSALFTSNYSKTIVKICQALNVKIYGGSLWKPDLDSLLSSEELHEDEPEMQLKNQSNINERRLNMSTEEEHMSKIGIINTYRQQQKSKETVVEIGVKTQKIIQLPSQLSLKSDKNEAKNYLRSFQRIKLIKQQMKRLNSYKIANDYFAKDKLSVKTQIYNKYSCNTPQTLIIKSVNPEAFEEQQAQFLLKLTNFILQFKNNNKWIFKISDKGRFSRGLAWIETDSLKVIKDKKKKKQITPNDIQEISSIIKLILLDRLELPQNDLYSDRGQFYRRFLLSGGYIEPFITDSTSACVFGHISAGGNFSLQGTYSKIYTDSMVNCCAFYPAVQIPNDAIVKIGQISANLYRDYKIFGHITFQLLVESRKNYYFIDFVPHLEQYSSLFSMYSAMLKIQEPSQFDRLSIIKSYQDQMTQKTKQQVILPEQNLQIPSLKRRIVYCPFIDNNGNIFQSFPQFQEACENRRLKMNFKQQEGLLFLYLNLQQKLPDVLSMFSMGKTLSKALKNCLEGLTFLMETSGDRTNRFDKKVERRKYDCLYINDLVWKLRQVKKALDNPKKH